MAKKKTPTPAQPPAQVRRCDERDFLTLYANNIFLESSVWDLKMVLGLLDQRSGVATTEQYGSLTISWPQAKILSYFLRLHIIFHEAESGKISLAPGGLPPEPLPLSDEYKADPKFQEAYDSLKKMYQELVGKP